MSTRGCCRRFGGADIDSDSGGWTPLYIAASEGHEEVVKLLLETRRVDVDSKDPDGCCYGLCPGAHNQTSQKTKYARTICSSMPGSPGPI